MHHCQITKSNFDYYVQYQTVLSCGIKTLAVQRVFMTCKNYRMVLSFIINFTTLFIGELVHFKVILNILTLEQNSTCCEFINFVNKL